MSLRIEEIPPATVSDRLEELARLRIAVFRDWPYLYDGDMAYEARYLSAYADSEAAVIVGAWDGARLVGAATGTPLEDHADDFGAPIRAAGLAIADVFYCAESVLLPEYRGQGAGHAFFDRREAHARRLGRRWSTFSAVVRPDDHPARPETYTPLDGFWTRRGYRPLEGGRTQFAWRDIGAAEETEKPMQMWLREL